MSEHGFGWAPGDHPEQYYTLSFRSVPDTVEILLKIPDVRTILDQGNTPRCVVFSSQYSETINAWLKHTAMGLSEEEKAELLKIYSTGWLWKQCGGTNQGAQIDWAMKVLRKQGNVRVINGVDQPVDPREGISAYSWPTTVDGMRAWLSLGNPGVLGRVWHTKDSDPEKVNNEYWIGRGNAGGGVGGHAICVYGASDQRQAFALINSWGIAWPAPTEKPVPTWIPYETIRKDFEQEGAEFCAPQDSVIGPPNPPPPSEKAYIDVKGVYSKNGRIYSGRLVEV